MIRAISYYIVAITFHDGYEMTLYLESDADTENHFDKKLIKFRESIHKGGGDFIYLDRDTIARVDLEAVYND